MRLAGVEKMDPKIIAQLAKEEHQAELALIYAREHPIVVGADGQVAENGSGGSSEDQENDGNVAAAGVEPEDTAVKVQVQPTTTTAEVASDGEFEVDDDAEGNQEENFSAAGGGGSGGGVGGATKKAVVAGTTESVVAGMAVDDSEADSYFDSE
jgi:hypothetical protein